MGTSWVTRYSFLRFLRHVAIQEAKQEILRRSMAETPRFEPYSAFSALDRERKGFISQEDFSVFLKANGQHFSENDFRNLVERLDVNADGRVGVHDFATAVKPLDKLSLSVETSRVQNKSAGLEKDAAECLALFLANEIKLREDHRRRISLLFAQKDFSIHEAFNLFDCDLTGFITIGHVLEVFQDHTMPLTEEEAVVLFWRLDRDRDGFLSFTDFAGIFFPPCEVRKLRLPQFTDVTPPRLLFTKIKLETILGRNVVDLPSDYICVNHIRLGDRQGTRRPVLISERRLADPHALDTFVNVNSSQSKLRSPGYSCQNSTHTSNLLRVLSCREPHLPYEKSCIHLAGNSLSSRVRRRGTLFKSHGGCFRGGYLCCEGSGEMPERACHAAGLLVSAIMEAL